jgi:hypothetical protein
VDLFKLWLNQTDIGAVDHKSHNKCSLLECLAIVKLVTQNYLISLDQLWLNFRVMVNEIWLGIWLGYRFRVRVTW